MAFSRTVYVEMRAEQKCLAWASVIYGGLPPGQVEQAQLFNKENSGTTFIASDAIGMGLNLNIKRVIFWPCDVSVAWRRRSSRRDETNRGTSGTIRLNYADMGIVTTVKKEDNTVLAKALAGDLEPLAKPLATLEQVEKYCELCPDADRRRVGSAE